MNVWSRTTAAILCFGFSIWLICLHHVFIATGFTLAGWMLFKPEWFAYLFDAIFHQFFKMVSITLHQLARLSSNCSMWLFDLDIRLNRRIIKYYLTNASIKKREP